jgi:hypothetical protein
MSKTHLLENTKRRQVPPLVNKEVGADIDEMHKPLGKDPTAQRHKISHLIRVIPPLSNTKICSLSIGLGEVS